MSCTCYGPDESGHCIYIRGESSTSGFGSRWSDWYLDRLTNQAQNFTKHRFAFRCCCEWTSDESKDWRPLLAAALAHQSGEPSDLLELLEASA